MDEKQRKTTFGEALFGAAFLIGSVGFLVAVGNELVDAREDRWRRREADDAKVKNLLEEVVELNEKLDDVLQQDEAIEKIKAEMKKINVMSEAIEALMQKGVDDDEKSD